MSVSSAERIAEGDRVLGRNTRGQHLWVLLGFALLVRWLFMQPFYLPPDSLDYLNAWDTLLSASLHGMDSFLIRYVRLGMAFPMAFLRWLSDDNHFFAYAYVILTSLGSVWLTHNIAKCWGGAKAGIIAGGLLAIVPMEVIYGGVLLPDNPLSFFALVAFYFALKAGREDKNRSWYVVLIGLFIGLAYTCKITGLFFICAATVHVYSYERRIQHILLLGTGLALVIAFEILFIKSMIDIWHVRILETLGYATGSKGNYAEVDKTLIWWVEQIQFKIGALFWAAHKPTAALLVFMPHLTAFSLWRMWKESWNRECRWLLVWGGVFLMQQMLLSSVEPEPRLLLAALPYTAILTGLAFEPIWQRWKRVWRWAFAAVCVIITLAGSAVFWGTHRHNAKMVHAFWSEFTQIKEKDERAYLFAPYDYLYRLAHYTGLKNVLWNPSDAPVTYWAHIDNRYTEKYGQYQPNESMTAVLDTFFISPIRPIFTLLKFMPAVGDSSRAMLYRQNTIGAGIDLSR